MRKRKKTPSADGVIPDMADADLDRLLHAPTQPFDYPTGKTITEYLQTQGMGDGIDLMRPVASANPHILSARGGRKYELGRVLSSGSTTPPRQPTRRSAVSRPTSSPSTPNTVPRNARIDVFASAIADSGCIVPMPFTWPAMSPISSFADAAPAQWSNT